MTSRAEWNVIDRCLAVPADIERSRQAVLDGERDKQIDWLAIAAVANDFFVGPALWTAMLQPRLGEVVPEDACSYLEMLHARNAERNSKIRRQLLEVGQVLSSAGLRAVLLKGAAWLFDESGAPAADRMMRDIDLLVDAADLKAAVNALLAAGYRDTAQEYLDSGRLHFEEHGHFHHAPLAPADGEAIVEFHQDIAYRIDLLPAAEMIAASREVAPGLLLPSLGHRMLHNVIHSQISNSDRLAGRFDLRDGLDLARLVTACGPDFDWQAFAEQTRRSGCFAVLSGALHATHRILGTPLPQPFAGAWRGRLHGWRCAQQRNWPRVARAAAWLASMEVAFTWDRDAYAFSLDGKPGLRDWLRVNLRRGLRVSLFVGRWMRERAR